MPWSVIFHDDFEAEYEQLSEEVQAALLAGAVQLRAYGPALGRPYADTLNGSRHANMKELRFRAGGGVWRAAFAFDRERQAIVLVAGNKAGFAQRRFYKTLVAKADDRFDEHLASTERS